MFLHFFIYFSLLFSLTLFLLTLQAHCEGALKKSWVAHQHTLGTEDRQLKRKLSSFAGRIRVAWVAHRLAKLLCVYFVRREGENHRSRFNNAFHSSICYLGNRTLCSKGRCDYDTWSSLFFFVMIWPEIRVLLGGERRNRDEDSEIIKS